MTSKPRFYIQSWFNAKANFWNGVSWSSEYPDAILFDTKRDACKIAEKVGARELQRVSVVKEHGDSVAGF